MSTQQQLFNMDQTPKTGCQLKDEGIQKTSAANSNFIDAIRSVAKHKSNAYGTVTSDALRSHASTVGLFPKHPNAWGAVFKGKGWTRVGMTQSTRPEAHGRWIQVWKWTGDQA